jgi:hypothetical protein
MFMDKIQRVNTLRSHDRNYLSLTSNINCSERTAKENATNPMIFKKILEQNTQLQLFFSRGRLSVVIGAANSRPE